MYSNDKGRGVAQFGLAHLTGGQGVAGSNPVAPTKFCCRRFFAA